MEKGHTSREFDRELRTLRDKLLAMGGRAEEQIGRAVQALVKRDEALANAVIADDQAIDEAEIGIDELAFLILARRQPVASDLRFVMLALKVVTDLERIGDLAVNIAKRVRDLARFAPSQLQDRIELLAQRVLSALQMALDAFVHADAERAEKVIDGDRDIDALNMHVIADVISGGDDKDVNAVARALALSSVSRYLERIGDHATNIAEMVIYFVRGRDVRHHWPRPRG
ncbi:MAG TPA: phosphate signaling complex protein PhoU [Polyangia bacterium]|nr:phosphate signaling complex protein PhoU [Polyangia bacterium]